MSLRLLPMEVPFPAAAASPAYDGLKSGADSDAFGRSWQESAFELGAIALDAPEGVLRDIRHTARRDLAALATHADARAGGGTHVEVLAANEWITRVDVKCAAFGGVVALRLHTNRSRVTQWVGNARGYVDSVEAPRGFVINAIVGTRPNGRCWPLGVLCCPLSMVVPSPSLTPRQSLDLVCKSYAYGAALHDGAQRVFEEVIDTRAGDAVRAVVVRCDFHVMRVWVLSSAEFDVFATFKDRAPLGRDEFCLALAPDETIVRVDIQSHKVVNAVRFATSQSRKTPWWGRAAFGSVARIDCQGREDGRTFAGLYGTIGDNFVGALGVVFGSPAESKCL